MSEFSNCYQDASRAEAYARLEFPATYYLAYRDLPEILRAHTQGSRALDFGCGTGRSSRFLKQQGFTVTGVDISEAMIRKAREFDPDGDYHLIQGADFSRFEKETYDLVMSAFTFDNIPGPERKIEIFASLASLLKSSGTMINLVSSPEIYVHEWASFSTKDFPENQNAKSGDTVRIVVTALEDRRPVEDIYWTDASYQEVYSRTGLVCVRTHRPLGKEEEPYPWISETKISPWAVYVLKKK